MKTTVTYSPTHVDPEELEEKYSVELREHEIERLEAYNENVAGSPVSREIPAGTPIPREGEVTRWFYDDSDSTRRVDGGAILEVSSVEWTFHPGVDHEEHGQTVSVFYTPLLVKQVARRAIRESRRARQHRKASRSDRY